MPRRVQPGDRLAITAAEYNRLLAAADAMHRNRLPGGAGVRTHIRTMHQPFAFITLPARNSSRSGASSDLNHQSRIPTPAPSELARFVRDATIRTVRPNEDEHARRFGVAIEPIRNGEVGRVVFDGVVAARVNVTQTWHRFADVAGSGGETLQSKPDGSAQILWRKETSATGPQWAIVRVGRPADPVYLVKVPAGGIAARLGSRTGAADCDLYELDKDGEITPVVDPTGQTVRVTARNHSAQRIRGPVEGGSQDQYLIVAFDGHRSWVIDPPKQTLLCKPVDPAQSKILGHGPRAAFRWHALAADRCPRFGLQRVRLRVTGQPTDRLPLP
jgi:hypothetical protein